MSENNLDLEAELFYRKPLLAGEPKPSFGLSEPDPDRPELQGFTAKIRNSREKQTSLDQEGFCLVNHRSETIDFYDDAEVQSRYYPEMRDLAKKLTRADFVQILSNITRNEKQAAQGKRLGAHRLVHNDFTPDLAQTLKPLIESHGIKPKRVRVFNLWRRFDFDAVDAPLAVCDSRTVGQEELIATDLHNYGEGTGFQVEIYQSSYQTKHRWFYYPKMKRDEVLVFQTYDSQMEPFSPTLHSAFDDPGCPQNVSPRESIEVRAVCLYI
ncbi:MAG: hypothetical protein CMQ40_10920 [Gammaproteobacteria bacterium]|nr:hypothetical protein [Gammaproteobacteria bacterium]